MESSTILRTQSVFGKNTRKNEKSEERKKEKGTNNEEKNKINIRNIITENQMQSGCFMLFKVMVHPDQAYTKFKHSCMTFRACVQPPLTRQSAGTNDSPRDPLHRPVTWNTSNFPDLCLRIFLHSCATPQFSQVLCLCINTLLITVSAIQHKPHHRHWQFRAGRWFQNNLSCQLPLNYT